MEYLLHLLNKERKKNPTETRETKPQDLLKGTACDTRQDGKVDLWNKKESFKELIGIINN